MKKFVCFLAGIVIFGMLLFVANNKDDIGASKIETASGDSGDIGNWDYTGTSYSVGSQDNHPADIFWDGTNWWMTGISTSSVYKYTSDWQYTGYSYPIVGIPVGISWDGTNWWIASQDAGTVHKYTSDWQHTGTSYYLGAQDTRLSDIFWDGTNLWMTGVNSDSIHKYDSDWVYAGESFYIGTQDIMPMSIFGDGINWWMLGHDSHRIYEYDSNWNYIGDNFYFGGEDITPMSIYKVNSIWWMLGHEHDRVFEYGDLNNEFENTLPDQNPFLIYLIVGLSSGILGISLIFIYVLKTKKKKTQTLVRKILDKKKRFCPICFTELKQGEKKCFNCENALKEDKMREKFIRMKQKSTAQRNKKVKGRNLKRFKNWMLRETIGAFIAPLLVPLLLLTYDFPTEFNITFIVVVSIVSPLIGLLFLRTYLKANAKYKESLNQGSSSFRTRPIDSNSFKKKERPISEVDQDFKFSRPINEVSKLKIEEYQSNSSISNNIDMELRVKSYACKTCGKQLIKKASYCPYCGK